MDPSFDALAPFAKSFAIKEEETTENQEEETEDHVSGNPAPLVSGASEADGPHRPKPHKEASEGHAVTAQPNVQRKKVKQKQLERGRNKDTDDREVKNEVKEEVDEGGNIRAKDQQAGVVKEALKRNGKEKLGKKDAPDDVAKVKGGKPNEVVMKEEEVDDAMPPHEPTVEREKDEEVWKRGRKSPREDPAVLPRRRTVRSESAKRRKTAESEDEEDASAREKDDDHQGEQNEPLGGMTDCDFGRMDSDINDTESPVKKKKHVKTKRTRVEKDKDVGDSDGGGEDRGAKIEKRRSCRLMKPVNYAMEKDSDDESSDEDGDDSSDSKEEDRERAGRSRRGASDGRATEEEQEEEMDQTVDVDDGNDQKKCPVAEYTEKPGSHKDLAKHKKKHPKAVLCDDEEMQKKRMRRSRKDESGEEGDEASDGESAAGDQEDEEVHETMDEDDLVNDGNEEEKCPIDGCLEILTSSEDLVKHMRKHPRPWMCGICKRSWKTRSHLRQHYRKHTGEKPFMCDVCKQAFAQECNLKTHQRIHTGERPYACDICEYRTVRTAHLKEHKRTHTGERPYSCTVCKQHFTLSATLINHIRTHTGERPYECDICGYKASQMTHLTAHKRIHTGEKPYSCTCGYKTRHSSALSAHKKRDSH